MKRLLLLFLLLAATAKAQLTIYPAPTENDIRPDSVTTPLLTADSVVSDSVSVTRTAHGAMGSTEQFNAAVGFHTGTLDANCTITVINWATSGTASTLTLQITQNATGYFNITWPDGVTNPPPIDPVPSHITVITLLTSDGGTSILASSNFTGINSALPVDDTYSGTVITGLNAGATIAQWQVVYLNSSSQWVLADADGSGMYPARGIAVTAGTSGNPLTVLTQGTIRNDGWSAWTVGGQLYLSATAGAITQSAPSNPEQIGVALAAKIILVDFGSAVDISASIPDGSVTFAKLATAAWDDDTSLTVPSSTRVPTTNAVSNFVMTQISANLVDYLPLGGGTMSGQLIASPGTGTSNTAGIKLVSGTLQGTPQAGAVEFLTDALYFTQTTGDTRKSIVLAPSTGPVTIVGTTAARTMTVPNANFTAARTDAANTFTGIQGFLSAPSFSVLPTGAGVASAATASTLASRDASASLLAQAFVASGTAPSCTGATIGSGSKNNAGFVTTATTGTTTVVVTFSTTAPTGWAIYASNNTTANLIRQTASSATTATFSGTTVSGDVMSYIAMAY